MHKAAALAILGALALIVPLTAGAAGRDSGKQTYVVLLERGASVDSAKQAVKRADGRVLSVNRKVGVATVRSSNADFVTDVSRSVAVKGAAHNRPVGEAPADQVTDPFAIERMAALRAAAEGDGYVRRRGGGRPAPLEEPFADLQWDMKAIRATARKSYRRQQGNSAVRVGILDTGIDGSHADIAPNFNRSLSRNFTTDDPAHRRRVRRGSGRLVHRPGGRGRGRPRHARGRHRGRADQPARDGRRGPEAWSS